jgi:hypothetical protein
MAAFREQQSEAPDSETRSQWVQGGGKPAMLERLQLPETCARIRNDVACDGPNNWDQILDWDCVRISPTVPFGTFQKCKFDGRASALVRTEPTIYGSRA